MPITIHKAPVSVGAEKLESTLRDYLAHNNKVLWLVSGGSNAAIETEIAQNIAGETTGFLTAALVDERYGESGHADSNYKKLVDTGFENSGILLTSILQHGLSLPETNAHYADRLYELMDEADIVVAQLGIGADGHTAGVLPGSPVVDSTKLVEYYHGPDFDRITLTLDALKAVNQAFVFCYGDDKMTALQNLKRDLALAEQPSQILKQIPSVYLYNDQIEGDSA